VIGIVTGRRTANGSGSENGSRSETGQGVEEEEEEEVLGVGIAEGSAIHMRVETGRWRKEWGSESCFVSLMSSLPSLTASIHPPSARVFLSKMRTYVSCSLLFVHPRWVSFGRSQVYLARVTEIH